MVEVFDMIYYYKYSIIYKLRWYSLISEIYKKNIILKNNLILNSKFILIKILYKNICF